MGYQPGAGKSGRPRGFDKPKKAKTRKVSNRQSEGPRRRVSEAQTLQEVVDRTLAGLENLGTQTFATPPFHQHYDRWLRSLITVLDDFEASPAVKADDRFHAERGELLTAVDAALKAEQAREAEREAKILGTRGSKDQLLQAEHEHEVRLRELSARRDEKLKALNDAVESLRFGAHRAGGRETGLYGEVHEEEGAEGRGIECEDSIRGGCTQYGEGFLQRGGCAPAGRVH